MTPGAVVNHKLGPLDNPEQLYSVVIIKYRGDRPVQEKSVIYMQAYLHPVKKVRKSAQGHRGRPHLYSMHAQVSRFAPRGVSAPRDEVLVKLEEKVRRVEQIAESRGRSLGALKVKCLKHTLAWVYSRAHKHPVCRA